MKRYEKYTSSRLIGTQPDWLGDIPSHWQVKQIKHLLQSGKEGIKIGPFGSALKLDFIKESGYKIYGQENIIKDDFQLGYKYIDDDKYRELANYKLESGDIVVTMMGTTGKAKIVPKNIEVGIMDSHLTRIRINSKLLIPRLLELLINNSYLIASQVKFQSKGAIMDGLNSTIIKSLFIPIPPVQEQIEIVHHLNQKTSELDTLITKKEKLIELLKEERTAIINQAVTKGLDPDVEMKDSGADGGDHRWLGEIPARWEVKKLKYLLKDIRGGGTPSTDNPEYWLGNIPWVSPKDMKVPLIETTEDYVSEKAIIESSTQLIEPNQLLLVVRSGILKHTLPLAINLVPVTLNQDMKALYTNELISVSYLYWLFYGLAGLILNWCKKNGATVDSLDMEAFLNFSLAIPPLEEQNKIIDYIVAEKDRVDILTFKIEQEITLLKEYKTALISEVVTGKVKVV